ncbi:MAG: ribose-5-phosphate isomerase [Planctomycetota bacterium]|nr:MAG: ribose-5-phosphate isomerase [Planctomycetota bacterium]
MKIAIGSDHAGTESKTRLVKRLTEAHHEVRDLGTNGPESVDYPDYAEAVGRAVSSGAADFGLLICGTGIGMCITANKVPGVRAAKCNDAFEARMCRAHNNANVLCLGERVLDAAVLDELVDVFLAEPFEGGRHERRVNKMNALDASTPGSSTES